ncbi:MAG: haloalkane dehalogenase, partial [Rubrivivax sp.]
HASRTPDDRFANLPGFGHEANYFDHAQLRVHYVDTGPRDADVTVLCLHGNPTWSYLYRKMIPVFTAAGLRVVAPDLIGFGRSDKPDDESAHTFDLHRGMLLALVEKLGLKNVLLVVQDWGGLFGLTLPMVMPERFTRLLVMNTQMGTGDLTDGFRDWRAYSNSKPDLEVGRLLARGNPEMTEAEAAAYDAPFPDADHKAALRAFPNLVPDGSDAPGADVSREAQAFWRDDWDGESYMAIGMQDPVLGADAMNALRKVIRNCPPPLELADAGHFVQETHGDEVARAALKHFGLG